MNRDLLFCRVCHVELYVHEIELCANCSQANERIQALEEEFQRWIEKARESEVPNLLREQAQ